jgi:hypothetical protein
LTGDAKARRSEVHRAHPRERDQRDDRRPQLGVATARCGDHRRGEQRDERQHDQRAGATGGGAEATEPDRSGDRDDEEGVADVRVVDDQAADSAGGDGHEREQHEGAEAMRAVGGPLGALERQRQHDGENHQLRVLVGGVLEQERGPVGAEHRDHRQRRCSRINPTHCVRLCRHGTRGYRQVDTQ